MLSVSAERWGWSDREGSKDWRLGPRYSFRTPLKMIAWNNNRMLARYKKVRKL